MSIPILQPIQNKRAGVRKGASGLLPFIGAGMALRRVKGIVFLD
jgi:hypothetical protein